MSRSGDGFKPRSGPRRAAVREAALERRALSAFGELDGSRESMRAVIAVKPKWHETKRQRETRERLERKIKMGVIR